MGGHSEPNAEKNLLLQPASLVVRTTGHFARERLHAGGYADSHRSDFVRAAEGSICYLHVGDAGAFVDVRSVNRAGCGCRVSGDEGLTSCVRSADLPCVWADAGWVLHGESGVEGVAD